MLKTGFLLPRSTVYPVIGYDFLDGFRSFFEATGASIPGIITQNIGFGIDEAEVYSKNEELLLKNNADIVIAFMDSRSAEMIQPLFAATGKILLMVNMGANYSNESVPGACTLNHTFNVAYNSWLTGKLASDEGHKQAVFSTSYYDAGYLQCFAMATRYLDEGKNQIVHNYVSHYQKDLLETASLEEYLSAHAELNTLLSLFSGDVSPLFYQALSRMQQSRELHVYASPMMLDESLAPLLGDDFRISRVKGFTSWNSQVDTAANKQFMQSLAAATGRQAGIFSLLGWEVAMIVSQAQRLQQEGVRGIQAVKQLMELNFESPRGSLRFDADMHQSYSSPYLVQVSDGFKLETSEPLEDNAAERKKFYTAKPAGESSGWRNTYLCS